MIFNVVSHRDWPLSFSKLSFLYCLLVFFRAIHCAGTLSLSPPGFSALLRTILLGDALMHYPGIFGLCFNRL